MMIWDVLLILGLVALCWSAKRRMPGRCRLRADAHVGHLGEPRGNHAFGLVHEPGECESCDFDRLDRTQW